jgi:hypothetical protein
MARTIVGRTRDQFALYPVDGGARSLEQHQLLTMCRYSGRQRHVFVFAAARFWRRSIRWTRSADSATAAEAQPCQPDRVSRIKKVFVARDGGMLLRLRSSCSDLFVVEGLSHYRAFTRRAGVCTPGRLGGRSASNPWQRGMLVAEDPA